MEVKGVAVYTEKHENKGLYFNYGRGLTIFFSCTGLNQYIRNYGKYKIEKNYQAS